MPSRRNFLKHCMTVAAAACWSAPLPALAHARPNNRLTAFSTRDGQHFVGVIDPLGRLVHRLPVSSRGHGARISADGSRALFFARRPGDWMLLMNPETGELLTRTRASQGRHFYGHGAFSHDGKTVFTTENDFEAARGVIGIYDADNLKRLGEWESRGVGPHEIALLNRSNTLVVANGGILTHPDTGRIKLNLGDMRPRLTYIDSISGRELESLAPPHHQLSLRHLCVSEEDTVFVAAQFEGLPGLALPLVFSHTQGQALIPFGGQPAAERQAIKDYVASISLSADAKHVATSEPRGNRVTIWHAREGRWLESHSLPDIGGITAGATRNALMATSGNGGIYEIEIGNATTSHLQQYRQLNWDNHLF